MLKSCRYEQHGREIKRDSQVSVLGGELRRRAVSAGRWDGERGYKVFPARTTKLEGNMTNVEGDDSTAQRCPVISLAICSRCGSKLWGNRSDVDKNLGDDFIRESQNWVFVVIDGMFKIGNLGIDSEFCDASRVCCKRSEHENEMESDLVE
ncbi:hypothetical protein K438DRAFT_1758892 [Mycena galopus ATCC 62051]|nr:hypothetical protein K438DRAFT_1758892 [Mycena galopus ATCC 62051]